MPVMRNSRQPSIGCAHPKAGRSATTAGSSSPKRARGIASSTSMAERSSEPREARRDPPAARGGGHPRAPTRGQGPPRARHRLPDLYRQGKNRARFMIGRWLERRALVRARGLIAISRYTADDLVRLLEIPRDRIAVTPLAVRTGLARAPEPEVAAFCRRHRLRASYLLYVGGIDRRTNIPFLLDVLRAIVAQRPETELVLAGRYRDDPDFADLVARLKRLRLEGLVRLVGY